MIFILIPMFLFFLILFLGEYIGKQKAKKLASKSFENKNNNQMETETKKDTHELILKSTGSVLFKGDEQNCLDAMDKRHDKKRFEVRPIKVVEVLEKTETEKPAISIAENVEEAVSRKIEKRFNFILDIYDNGEALLIKLDEKDNVMDSLPINKDNYQAIKRFSYFFI